MSTVQRVLNWRKLFNVAIRMVLNQDLTDFILAKLILQSYLLGIKVLIHIFPWQFPAIKQIRKIQPGSVGHKISALWLTTGVCGGADGARAFGNLGIENGIRIGRYFYGAAINQNGKEHPPSGNNNKTGPPKQTIRKYKQRIKKRKQRTHSHTQTHTRTHA